MKLIEGIKKELKTREEIWHEKQVYYADHVLSHNLYDNYTSVHILKNYQVDFITNMFYFNKTMILQRVS